MDHFDIMQARHSVRQYLPRPIEEEKRAVLDGLAAACSAEGGLRIQIIYDEPECFDSFLAHYGWLSGVCNYIALVGKQDDALDEKCGYYGQQLVLKAQELGLNTCWVAATYRKGKCAATVAPGEKLCCVIALGYGKNQGVPHRNKPMSSLCRCDGPMPDWFRRGMEAAMLAPTAVNQQKFCFLLRGDAVTVRAGRGACTRVDLGIVKYHFELGSGRRLFEG